MRRPSPGVTAAKLFLLAVLIVALCSCQTAPSAPSDPIPKLPPAPTQPAEPEEPYQTPAAPDDEVNIIVTRDFGSQVILDETISISGDTSAMAALMEVAEVETSYGGGFVDAINGLSSGYSGSHTSKEDWFVFFNGIMSNTGALDYPLQPGDTEHWDYHNWDFHQFVPAIIGDYPAPFRNGYRGKVYPTVVVYQDGWEETAREIADSLAELGVGEVTCRDWDELSPEAKEKSNLILLGDSNFAPITELNEPWNRLGFYGRFEDGSLRVFDPAGNLSAEYNEGAGLIQATQSIWNPKGTGACENVVWMVSGLDEAGVRAAAETLIDSYYEFRYAGAAVIADGKILKVP
jgi:hypothetical protein